MAAHFRQMQVDAMCINRASIRVDGTGISNSQRQSKLLISFVILEGTPGMVICLREISIKDCMQCQLLSSSGFIDKEDDLGKCLLKSKLSLDFLCHEWFFFRLEILHV